MSCWGKKREEKRRKDENENKIKGLVQKKTKNKGIDE